MNNDMTPAERLRAARINAGYSSAAEAARAIGLSTTTYVHHENGTRGFTVDNAERYARAFKVSTGYLLGIEEDGPVSEKTTVGEHLRELCRRAGFTQEELAQAMGLSRASSIQRYLDAESISIDKAVKFALALGGRGDPPIDAMEVLELVDFPFGLSSSGSRASVKAKAPTPAADDLLSAANRIADALETIADLLARPRGVL